MPGDDSLDLEGAFDGSIDAMNEEIDGSGVDTLQVDADPLLDVIAAPQTSELNTVDRFVDQLIQSGKADRIDDEGVKELLLNYQHYKSLGRTDDVMQVNETLSSIKAFIDKTPYLKSEYDGFKTDSTYANQGPVVPQEATPADFVQTAFGEAPNFDPHAETIGWESDNGIYDLHPKDGNSADIELPNQVEIHVEQLINDPGLEAAFDRMFPDSPLNSPGEQELQWKEDDGVYELDGSTEDVFGSSLPDELEIEASELKAPSTDTMFPEMTSDNLDAGSETFSDTIRPGSNLYELLNRELTQNNLAGELEETIMVSAKEQIAEDSLLVSPSGDQTDSIYGEFKQLMENTNMTEALFAPAATQLLSFQTYGATQAGELEKTIMTSLLSNAEATKLGLETPNSEALQPNLKAQIYDALKIKNAGELKDMADEIGVPYANLVGYIAQMAKGVIDGRMRNESFRLDAREGAVDLIAENKYVVAAKQVGLLAKEIKNYAGGEIGAQTMVGRMKNNAAEGAKELFPLMANLYEKASNLAKIQGLRNLFKS